MRLSTSLIFWGTLHTTWGSSLIDFSAARGDSPSILGIRDLEGARGVTVSSNTAELYIELGTDPSGVAALHCHRIEGDIRAEYHALSGRMEADQTYYIGYQFSLAEIEQSLMIWQLYVSIVYTHGKPGWRWLTQEISKEYEANNAADGGANIPLSLEIQNGVLHFQYQSSYSTPRVPQWSITPKANTPYSVGIVINTGSPGWVELYWQGQQQTFTTSGTTKVQATTFPGRTEPKFGSYRGEVVGIDTYIYRIQIGTTLSDISAAAGLSSSSSSTSTISKIAMTSTTSTSGATSTTTCSWAGHCEGY